MKNQSKAVIVLLAMLLMTGTSIAGEWKELHKEFSAKKTLDISTTSGDCIIKQGSADKIIVDVKYNVRPEKAFEPDFKDRSGTLKIKERWSGSSSGDVIWTIQVPKEIEIEFSTASGDLTVTDAVNDINASTASGDITLENVKGSFDISTASGDVDADEIEGEIEISTASGEIKIKDSKGMFELSCASGDVQAERIIIEDVSTFSTASGDVEVSLAKSTEHDLELSAASGDVRLEYNGNNMKGYFELSAKKRSGSISSSVKFDGEDEFERHGRTYVKKYFTAGSKEPEIRLSTASGKVTLKK